MNPSPPPQHRRPAWSESARSALRIVLAYALFASLWIMLSDKAVGWLFSDPQTMLLVSIVKGWLFVAVTSFLLFGLIRPLLEGFMRSLATVQEREQELMDSKNQLQQAQRIAALGSYELDVASGQWTSSAICDQVFGIDAQYQRSVSGWLNLVHADDRAMMQRYLQEQVIGQGRAFDKEYRVVRQCDQVVRWVHGLGQLEFGPQGQPTAMHGTIQDIDEQKQAEIQIEVARSQLQATLDALPDLLFEVDEQGHIHRYHSHRSDLLAAPPEVFLGKSFAEILPPEVASLCHSAIAEAAQHGFSSGKRYALRLPQGEHWFDLSAAPMRVGIYPQQRFILIARDVTERRAAEEKLQLAGSVFTHAIEGIAITSADGSILDVNQAFTRITGYSRDEVIGLNPRMLKSGHQEPEFYEAMWRDLVQHGYWSGEIWNRRKDGLAITELLTISAVRDPQGQIQQYVALYSDITALKEHQNQLEHMAHFDALTKLPNRLLLADRLQQAMNQALRREQQLAVVYLDLDGFKTINDQHGHDVGDQFLIALAHRLKETLREGDTLARLGGDEFVAVLIDLPDADASVPMLNRLLAAAAEPVHVGGLSLRVSASLGVTFYPQHGDLDADQLLRQADQAMYQAKLGGKNRYHLFDAAQDSSIRGHHEGRVRIHEALEHNEFVLYYQPKVNMRSGEVIGAEALIRWQHPERGLLPPGVFLPLIEEHPMAIDVGEWVIAAALKQMTQWQTLGLSIPVSVNLSARQLQQPEFVQRLSSILQRFPEVDPCSLELEILETSALQDIDQVSQVIEACSQMGVSFALDDFGTGYSSLTYLKRLHVTVLKIDQSFVRDMLNDPDDLAILQGVLSLASAFKRKVIAEGVETVEHGSLLLQLGCELAQGYGVARPMPADALPGWAAQWRPDPAWRDFSDITWLSSNQSGG